jgi:ADP-ribose pyrophosphatase YjhB (NUDIX family)
MIEGTIRYCSLCGTQTIEQFHTGKLRPTCQNCGWVYFPDPKVAVIVLIREQDQVLLVQRKYDPQKGHWTLPSGFVDAGEDPILAAEREVSEETGLTISNLILADVIYSQAHPRGASILILYRAQIQSGMLRAGDDANKVAFFNIHNLPPLAFESTYHIIESFVI